MTLASAAIAAAACVFYVSPIGSDSNNGTTPSRPFATVRRARDATRAHRHQHESCTVNLAAGLHRLNGTLMLDSPALDSGTTWAGDPAGGTVLSTGIPIPPACWAPLPAIAAEAGVRAGVRTLACAAPPAVVAVAAARGGLKTLRIGSVFANNAQPGGPDGLAVPARFPDLQPAAQFDGDWLIVNSSTYLGAGTNAFVIGVESAMLPAFARAGAAPPWKGGLAHIWPVHSWIDILGATLVPSAPPAHEDGGGGGGGLAYFKLTCPDQLKCTATSNSMGIAPGVRFYIYGTRAALSAPNEWFYDRATSTLLLNVEESRLAADAGPITAFVPTASAAVWVAGTLAPGGAPARAADRVSGVLFADIAWTDVGFDAQGGQEGFGQANWPPAPPGDAALRVSGASNVTVARCRFAHLGSGGVHVGNASLGIRVVNTTFWRTGQSGVMFTGNATSQPSGGIIVENNTMAFPGSVLASAAGILATTVSGAVFRGNTIRYSSRWGIAVRSEPKGALSRGNLLELNRIYDSGMKTRDLGGISLLGPEDTAAPTGTVIRSNCVKRTVGMDTTDHGVVLRPFFTWSIYLDNLASGFHITGNVVNGDQNGGVFIHGGSLNVIENNVFHNTSSRSPHADEVGEFGYYHGAPFDVGYIVTNHQNIYRNKLPHGNQFVRNLVVSYHNDSMWNVPSWPAKYFWNGTANAIPAVTAVDHNLYFNPTLKIAAMKADREGFPVFPTLGGPAANNGTWAGWRAAQPYAYDAHSKVDVAPGFVDAAAGDFRLAAGAAAREVGFVDLDERIAQC